MAQSQLPRRIIKVGTLPNAFANIREIGLGVATRAFCVVIRPCAFPEERLWLGSLR